MRRPPRRNARSDLERDFIAFRRHGDAAALARVFDAAVLELMRVAAHLASDRHTAEDLVQATFLVAMKRKHQFDARRKLMPWLLGILANQARIRRRDAARAVDPERLPYASPADPIAAAQSTELTEALRAALDRLPEPYRPVLDLHLRQGLSAREIAARLARRRGTVRSQLSRGIELLRQLLPPGFVAALALRVVDGREIAAMRHGLLADALGPAAEDAARTRRLWPASSAARNFAVPTLALALGALALPILLGRREPSSLPELHPTPVGTSASDPSRGPNLGAGPFGVERFALTRARARHAKLSVRVNYADGTPAAETMVLASPVAIDGLLAAQWRRTDARGAIGYGELEPGAYDLCWLNGGDRQRVMLLAGKSADVQLGLPAGVSVTGQVVDAAGHPLAGARVQVAFSADQRHLAATAVVADAEGRFALRDMQPGRAVSASAPSRVPSWVEVVDSVDRSPLRLVCGGPASTIEGTVLGSDGRPLRAACVVLGAVASPQGSGYGNLPVASLWTDDAGSFCCTEVPPGRVPLWIGARGHAPHWEVIDVRPAGTARVRVRLEVGTTLAGVVRDRRGSVLHGAAVAASFEGLDLLLSTGPPWAYAIAHSDAEGRYALPHIPRRRAQWTARLGDREASGPTVQVGDAQQVRWDPVLEEPVSCAVEVVDEAGHPYADWQLALRREGRAEDAARAITDAQGRFRIMAIDGIGYELWGRDPASEVQNPFLLSDHVVLAQEQRIVLPARYRATSFLAGEIRSPTGDPASGALLTVLWRTGAVLEPLARGQLGSDGRFRVGPLPAGELALVFGTRATGMRIVEGIDLPAQRDLTLEPLSLAPPARLVFRARGPLAAEVNHAKVDRGDGAHAHAPIAAGEGVLVVQPGTFDVSLCGTGVALNHARVEASAGEEILVEIPVEGGQPASLRFPPLGRRGALLTLEWRRSGAELMHRESLRWPPEGSSAHAEVTLTRPVPAGRHQLLVIDEQGRRAQSWVTCGAAGGSIEVALPR